MVFGLFRRRSRDAEHKVYCEIVAQARQPAFYSALLVPDTVDGRFDMIIAHAVLFFRRLRNENAEVSEFSQNVFDLFFHDMDASLREMGVSDTRVPKKIKAMGEAFYGRADAYIPAIDADDDKALAAALGRNIYTDTKEPVAQLRLARYLIAAARNLENLSTKDLVGAAISWPGIDTFTEMDV